MRKVGGGVREVGWQGKGGRVAGVREVGWQVREVVRGVREVGWRVREVVRGVREVGGRGEGGGGVGRHERCTASYYWLLWAEKMKISLP